ncbi:pentraxin-related protein PTX3 [Limanda limanda]|uniref:pentraxin-related protein PTX3 n=1 Tax=Limanda limanda TaxID=27771 RepID=UPI0029C6BA57|nr:pentraxin-related protein PTX3 [Limanda limanda]
MFWWRLFQAACVLSVCVCQLAFEDDMQVNYSDTYYNEILGVDRTQEIEPTPTSPPCSSRDLTKWDKLFSMLENSQMRENMMLQYAEDIIKVEMESLRGEMLRFGGQYGGSCGVAVETVGRRMAMQFEARLKETMERLKIAVQSPDATGGNSVEDPDNLESSLHQLLSAARAQTSQLTRLETSSTGAGTGRNTKPGFQLAEGGGAGHQEQEFTSREVALEGVLAALKQTRAEQEEALRFQSQRHLPAGCDMALLFPMRSRRIYTAVTPEVPLSISSFTICMWLKPTTLANKTVLFSYGHRRNPYEIQLLLGQTSALFTIGGEAHLVEARGVVKPGQWIHLCGAWASEQGLATLWADGERFATTPGVAEGHVLPEMGSLQLGQERSGCCPQYHSSGGGVSGFEGGFNSQLAFAGKMTGVNMWDRVLSEEEISELALPNGQGCEQRGNVVAWGITEMVPHGGAQFIY